MLTVMAELVPFSTALRERSRNAHSGSEGAGFMSDLMRGNGTRDDYVALVAQHWFIYEALEAAAAEVDDIPRGWLAGAFDAAALKTASRLGCASIHLALDGLEAAHVVAARAAGLEVLVYTVNRLADARRLASWGVGGLFTDRPDLLLDTIR